MITKTPNAEWTEQVNVIEDANDIIEAEDDIIEDDDDIIQNDDDITEDEDDALSGIDTEEDPEFTDYLWMENEEEFDKDELERLEQDELMQERVADLFIKEIGDAINEWQREKAEDLEKALSELAVSDRNVENSSLNPLADEFIPMQNYFNIIITN